MVINKKNSIFTSQSKTKDMPTIEQIQNELGQKISNIREFDGFLIFDCEDGIRKTNKLTKSGNHKKNSIRVY